MEKTDTLGMEQYYKGLAEYIKTCDTPRTITIEGDWGIGKTTTLKNIERILKSENVEPNEEQSPNEEQPQKQGLLWILIKGLFKLAKDLFKLINPLLRTLFCDYKALPDAFKKPLENTTINKYHFIEFNTWQYDSLGLDDNLSLALFTHLNTELDNLTSATQKKRKKENQKTAFSTVGKRMLNGYGNINEVAGLISETVNAFDDFANILNVQLVTEQISRLQKQIQDKINKYLPDGRLIIFIDDLDRLAPERAVDLLAGIQNLMHFEKCVFVLALDTKIINEGIERKYQDYPEDKKKVFLDKLIQVPYKLPKYKYTYEDNIKTLLEEAYKHNSRKNESNNEPKNLDKYIEIIKNLIDTNPRSIARIFDIFILHITIYNEVLLDKEVMDEDDLLNLFILVALEQKYPTEFYSLNEMTTGNDITADRVPRLDQLLKLLCDKEGQLDKGQLNEICNKIVTFAKSASELFSHNPIYTLKFPENINVFIDYIAKNNLDFSGEKKDDTHYIFKDKFNEIKLKFILEKEKHVLYVYTTKTQEECNEILTGHNLEHHHAPKQKYVSITIPAKELKDAWKVINEFLKSENVCVPD